MTFEEIQQAIQGMLSVQRNLQENQLKIQEKQTEFRENQTKIQENQAKIQENQVQSDRKIDRLTERIDNLAEQVENLNIISQRHEDRFTQFYGYHSSAETDRMRLWEVQDRIERRLVNIERKLDAR